MSFILFPKNLTQWKIILVAFMGAAIFWFFNALNKSYTTTLSHPVQFIYNTDSFISIQPLPKHIEMDVAGSGWNLMKKTKIFNPNPIKINLNNPIDQQYLYWKDLLSNIRSQIDEIEINHLIQDTLNLYFDYLSQRKIALTLDSTQFGLKKNFKITSSLRVFKDSISLKGPKQSIDTIHSADILQFDVNDIDENFDDYVDLYIPNLPHIAIVPNSVRVVFSVAEYKRYEYKILVEKVNFPKQDTTDNFVTIQFSIPKSLNKEFKSRDFSIISDFTSFNPQDSTVSILLVNHPPEVKEYELHPNVIKLTKLE